MYKNPITQTEFSNLSDFVDDLAKSYRDVKQAQFENSKKEEALLNTLLSLTPNDQKKGLCKLYGSEFIIKVTKRLNISYPKERGAEHPLMELTRKYQSLLPYVNFSVEEKGSQIQNMLDNPSEIPDQLKEAIEEIKKYRKETQGKPGIEVTFREDKDV